MSRINAACPLDAKDHSPRRDGDCRSNIHPGQRIDQTLDRCPSIKEGRRNVVQGWTTRGDWRDGTQKSIHMSPSQRTSIRTPGDQQNVPAYKPQILVAKHEARCDKLRTRVRGMSKEQDQYVAHKSPAVSDISYMRSYAIRNCRPGLHH